MLCKWHSSSERRPSVQFIYVFFLYLFLFFIFIDLLLHAVPSSDYKIRERWNRKAAADALHTSTHFTYHPLFTFITQQILIPSRTAHKRRTTESHFGHFYPSICSVFRLCERAKQTQWNRTQQTHPQTGVRSNVTTNTMMMLIAAHRKISFVFIIIIAIAKCILFFIYCVKYRMFTSLPLFIVCVLIKIPFRRVLYYNFIVCISRCFGESHCQSYTVKFQPKKNYLRTLYSQYNI